MRTGRDKSRITLRSATFMSRLIGPLPRVGALKGCWKVLPPPCLPQMRQKTVEFRGGERLPPKFLPLAF
ncbi:MAG: hypothetical protein DRI56_03965, partial [Chloroflexota bacterium]